ncbi:MAG: YraN family protein [Bacteroidetes bacterium]|nr:YraN family protein [Bacteroidota bacterium]MBU1373958.1 YraN family protein [Bacteroidota bacterium]MBU1485314.1 YraN family protein [Bacteroidota bacterium]MBU1761299.1 YraN family protein [Bacteroidota bacterium]MBU2268861.1 YraN family protein [Bacteroidota bacterium]
MATHNDDGKKAEVIAKIYLEEKGFEILDENWTFGKAEVDLIAYQNKTIIFIEVKARSGNYFGEPEEFVDTKKQQLLSIAAEEYIYLMEHKGEIRFDIISILFKKGFDQYEIKHIEDAFWNY